jgi:hypothetical protein
VLEDRVLEADMSMPTGILALAAFWTWQFSLDPPDLAALKPVGVSEAALRTMINVQGRR